MISCEVIEKFDLKDFDKLKNIKRKSTDVYGKLFVGDEFDCDEAMAKYLTGDNPLNKKVVNVIGVSKEEENIVLPAREENLEEIKEEINNEIKSEAIAVKPKKKHK